MSQKKYEKVNNKTGNKVTTTVSRSGNSKTVERVLQKSDGLFGSRFLGSTKVLSSKTYRSK